MREIREVREISGIREMREIREVREISGIREMREIREVREISGIREMREIREVREISGIREMREITEIREISEIQKIRKIRLAKALLFLLLTSLSLCGCGTGNGVEEASFFDRPAVGFTVTEEAVTTVDVPEQNSLSLSAQDGVVRVSRYDGDSIQLIEKRSLTGPAARKKLMEMLAENHSVVKKVGTEVKITTKPEKKARSLYRQTDELEVKIPDKVKTVTVDANSGRIEVAGMKGMSSLKLVLKKGSIKVDGSEAYLLHTEISNGNLDINGFTGSGFYKCDRGNVGIRDIKGSIKLKSLDGNAIIEISEGVMDCDIAAGSLIVRSCLVRKDTLLYTSAGEIDADLSNLESEGKYSVKASHGRIRVKLPEETGWSLLAESTNGDVTQVNLDAAVAKELKKAPSGETYGDIRGGGPDIFLYTDMGSIDLR